MYEGSNIAVDCEYTSIVSMMHSNHIVFLRPRIKQNKYK